MQVRAVASIVKYEDGVSGRGDQHVCAASAVLSAGSQPACGIGEGRATCLAAQQSRQLTQEMWARQGRSLVNLQVLVLSSLVEFPVGETHARPPPPIPLENASVSTRRRGAI